MNILYENLKRNNWKYLIALVSQHEKIYIYQGNATKYYV